LTVGPRARLESEPTAAFVLGEAPDGLPLVLLVRRSLDVRQPVVAAFGYRTELPAPIEAALAELERATRVHSVSVGMISREGRRYYETQRDVASLFGTTLFARMLGAISPIVMPEDARQPDAAHRFENSAMISMGDLLQAAGGSETATPTPPIVAPALGRSARVRVSLSGTEVFALHLAKAGNKEVEVPRPLAFESLLALRSARFATRLAPEKNSGEEGRLSDNAKYVSALSDAHTLGWSVARIDVATLVCELALSVEREWHARGRVHCDLKPGNVLLGREGIDAFDALDVRTGSLSIGVTAGWAAPEQIEGRPVTPATDVYALALMAASLLRAAIFGEERTVIVPAAGAGRRRVTLLTDPEVWIDPSLVALPTEARLAWRELLMRCLARNPERRPASGAAFAREARSITERWEIPGRILVECGPGRLERPVGGGTPIWLLEDQRG
jgi:hypothetical protein